MKTSARVLLAVVGVVALSVVGIGGFRAWQGRFPWEAAVPTVLSLPKPEADIARARSNTVGPKGGLVQVFTDQNAEVTLEIPAGALKEETEVKLVPFAFDPSAQTPTLGVLVSPGSLAFAGSARLTFDLSQSKFHLAAPDQASADAARRSGESQLLALSGDQNVVIPALAVRAVETKTSFTGLVPVGGAYLLSFGGDNRVAYARQGLARTPSRASVLEAAAFLQAHGAVLSKEEQAKASAASRSVLDEKNPRGEEFFAAVAVATSAPKKTAFIPVAHAAEISRAFFQKGCADRTRAFADLASLAHAARLLGDADMAKTCWEAAGRQAASVAKAVLSDRKAELPAMLAARTSLRVSGGTEAAALDKQLAASASKDVQAEAKVVLAQTKPSAPAVAAVLQATRVVPVDQPVKQQLAERLQDVAPHTPTVSGTGTGSQTGTGSSAGSSSVGESVVGGQELLSGAGDAVVGLGIATTLGFDPTNDASYQVWMNQLLSTTTFGTGETSNVGGSEPDTSGAGGDGPALDYDPTAYLCMMAAMYGVPDLCPSSSTEAFDMLQEDVSDEGSSDGDLSETPGTGEVTDAGLVGLSPDMTWWTSFSWMTDPAYLAALSAGGSDNEGETEEESSDSAVEEETEGSNFADPYLWLNLFGTGGALWTPPVDGGEGEEHDSAEEATDPMVGEEDAIDPDDRGDGPESEEEARDQGVLAPSEDEQDTAQEESQQEEEPTTDETEE